MDKTQLVKNWIRHYDVEQIAGGKKKAFGLGWKLLNDYLYFLETGRCPETKEEFYDYSQFIHTFADSIAGQDDDLYEWIVKYGSTLTQRNIQDEKNLSGELPNSHCPLCSVRLNSERVARNEDGSVRRSPTGVSRMR
ncbi:MAG: hypothetical protein FH749_02780 [Firmicutes bacterium]|nr:hypothetical protein [Bacillota bacterium]